MKGIIILAVFPALFVNTKRATKTFQNSVATDLYTLTEQSVNWQVVFALYYFEMHVIGLSLDSGNNNLMNL